MKEFTKSLFSYSLATAFFGLKQLDNMVSSSPSNGRKPPAIRSLDSVTCAMTAQLGETLTDTFRAADSFQRGFVELMFDVMFPFASSRARPERVTTVAVPVAEPQRWTEAMEPLASDIPCDPDPVFVGGRLA